MEHLTTVCTLTCKCQWCKPNAQCTCKCLIILSRLTFVKYRDEVVFDNLGLTLVNYWLLCHDLRFIKDKVEVVFDNLDLTLVNYNWLFYHDLRFIKDRVEVVFDNLGLPLATAGLVWQEVHFDVGVG